MNADELALEHYRGMIATSPFIHLLGMELVHVDAVKGSVELTMPERAEFRRDAASPHVHGGVIAALIDTAGAVAMACVIGAAAPTISFRTDYLRPAEGSDIRATAWVRRVGRSVGVVDIEVFNGDTLVALGRGTFGAAG